MVDDFRPEAPPSRTLKQTFRQHRFSRETDTAAATPNSRKVDRCSITGGEHARPSLGASALQSSRFAGASSIAIVIVEQEQ
jgi:hypothetical protein